MSNNNQSIVQQAVAYFKQGQYQQAKESYQQAVQQYGEHLFANSVRLCELRLSAFDANKGAAVSTVDQLEETQKLLEHYYTRCQELECQLIDRQEVIGK